jgi:hypothetical protein
MHLIIQSIYGTLTTKLIYSPSSITSVPFDFPLCLQGDERVTSKTHEYRLSQPVRRRGRMPRLSLLQHEEISYRDGPPTTSHDDSVLLFGAHATTVRGHACLRLNSQIPNQDPLTSWSVTSNHGPGSQSPNPGVMQALWPPRPA